MAIKVKATVSILLAFLFLGTAFGHYYMRMDECIQMTFMSNAATGCVFLFCGLYEFITQKDVPHFWHFDCAVMLASVIFVCAYFAPEECFVGGSIIPHIVNPVIMLVFYFLFCDGRQARKRIVFSATAFPTLYYIFMIVFCRLSGRLIYPYFNPNAMSALSLVAVAVFAEIMLLAIGMLLLYINRNFHTAADRRSAARNERAKSN